MAATLYRGVRVTAILDLLFLVGWTATLVTFGFNIPLAAESSDPWLRALQVVGVLGLIGAVGAVWNLIRVLTDSRRGWWAKLSNVSIVLAFAMVTWVEFCINAFNLSLNY